jgi:hypothetical protein
MSYLSLEPQFESTGCKNKNNESETKDQIPFLVKQLRYQQIIGHINHEGKVSDFEKGDFSGQGFRWKILEPEKIPNAEKQQPK